MSGDGARLDDCGCCEPPGSPTPVSHENSPGKARIDYRVGSHGTFKQALVSSLAAIPAPMDLRTDRDDDPSIALADASATMLDVLTFYQERIANEGYLRTATERRSVLELARQIGYELNPGVAATTALAFTMETAAGAPEMVTIPERTQVQSVPGPDEAPRTFETIESIEARPVWNAMRPQLTTQQVVTVTGPADQGVWLVGTDSGLKSGGAVLVVDDGWPAKAHWSFGRVIDVTPHHEKKVTKVTWRPSTTVGTPRTTTQIFALRTRASLFGHNAANFDSLPLALRGTERNPEADPMKLIASFAKHFKDDIAMPFASEVVASLNAAMGKVKEAADDLAEDLTLTLTAVPAKLADLQTDIDQIVGIFNKLKEFHDAVESARNASPPQTPPSPPDPLHIIQTLTDRSGTAIGKVKELTDHLTSLMNVSGVAPSAMNFVGVSAQAYVQLRINEAVTNLHLIQNSAKAVSGIANDIAGLMSEPATVEGPFARRRDTWADRYLDDAPAEIELDGVYDRITASTDPKRNWVVLAGKSAASLFQLTSVAERSLADFNLTAKATVLSVTGQGAGLFNRRTASVYAEPAPLALAPPPLETAMPRNAIALDQAAPSVPKGRRVTVTGRLHNSSADSRPVSEIAVVAQSVLSSGGIPTLHLEGDLARDYDRASTTINANVAVATHGETRETVLRDEVLGSGDASVAFQKFRLKGSPLTYVAADTPSGSRSTLQVRVHRVEWKEAARLYGQPPTARTYTVRATEDGLVDVGFGDGRTGARLPTGRENVTARYRVGTGLGGMVRAGQLTTLLSRPLGVKEVVNPLPAEGAADPEGPADARRSAPLTTTALERVVSLQDFEDFAAAFGGVGKAAATWLWAGEGRIVHITIAGSRGAELDTGSLTTKNLLAAIDLARHDDIPVRVGFYAKRLFDVVARVAIDPRYGREDVTTRVREKLLAAYEFQRREFGRALPASDVIARIQAVEGVLAVDMDRFHFTGDAPGPAPRTVLPAFNARWQGNAIAPAELITVNPDGITLLDYTP